MNSTLENKSDYYTKKTTLELLKVSENILKKLVVEFEIPTITGYYSKGGTNSYLKKTVDDIIALQKKEVDMYMRTLLKNMVDISHGKLTRYQLHLT